MDFQIKIYDFKMGYDAYKLIQVNTIWIIPSF